MKKIFALLILAMFVASAIPAFAQDGTDGASLDYQDPVVRNDRREERKVEAAERLNMDEEDEARTKARIRAEAVEYAKERLPAVRANALARANARVTTRAFELRAKADFKQFRNAQFKARDVAKERMQNARRLAAQAQEKAKEARNRFREARAKVQERKDALAACKGDESEDCVKKREEGKQDAITALQNAVDSAIAELEKVKARIEESEDLTEEEAQRLTAGLDEKLAKLEEVAQQIDNLNEESTKEEVKAAAQNLRSVLKEIKQGAKDTAGKLVNARIGRVVVRARHLEDNLNKVLERAENAGMDTSVLSGLVDEFNRQLDDAQAAYEQAAQDWRGQKPEAARESMQKATQLLKQAHETLKEIFHELKGQRMEDDLEEVSQEQEAVDAEPVYLDDESGATA